VYPRSRGPCDHYYLSVAVTKAKRGERSSWTNRIECIANDKRVGVVAALPCIRGHYFEAKTVREDQLARYEVGFLVINKIRDEFLGIVDTEINLI